MSSFSNVTTVRHLWRPVTHVAGWITGTIAMACVAAAVVLGGTTAAAQRLDLGVADPAEAWLTIGALLAGGLSLLGAAYLLFAASESDPDTPTSSRPPAVRG